LEGKRRLGFFVAVVNTGDPLLGRKVGTRQGDDSQRVESQRRYWRKGQLGSSTRVCGIVVQKEMAVGKERKTSFKKCFTLSLKWQICWGLIHVSQFFH